MDKGVTGGCINCARCERVRTSFFCGRSRLTMKQVYNTKGYCSKFKPKEALEAVIKEEEQNVRKPY